MRVAWYDQQGPAEQVLQVGELPDPKPATGEVRVRVRYSGVNPGDTKKRRGWLGSTMPYPRVIPHSDAAGVIDQVGEGVDPERIGRRVWVYGAQSYRPFGTAAQYVAVADYSCRSTCLTPPPTSSARVWVSRASPPTGPCSATGPSPANDSCPRRARRGSASLAGQLARWGDATVIGTVRRGADLARTDLLSAHHVVALDGPDPPAEIRSLAGGGVDRIVEVAFSDNADLDAAVARLGAVIAAYATGQDRSAFPFWPMLFNNLTIRLLGSDDFPLQAKQDAATDLTSAAASGALAVAVGAPLPLWRIAAAHDRVEAGTRRRVLIDPNA